jgi:3-hydroxybutyryl-CoA dehydrogenase
MASEKVMDIEILNREINNEGSDHDTIKSVAIVGAGVMGQGISILAASKGLDVILIEVNKAAAELSIKEIDKYIDGEIARWTMTASEKKAILARIQTSWDIQDAQYSDIAIEAVTENFETKTRVLSGLSEHCSDDTILITNTSALSISSIAENIPSPERIIGMHFLNPVPKIPLVELVRARKTSDETVKKAEAFSKMLDKTAVEVYEYPGYITTRIIIPLINEAIHVVMEGIASAQGVDTAMKLGYGFPIGPLSLADQIGLDELLAWMETLFSELGDAKYRPCPLLRKMVRDGKIGRKVGEGFFSYK